MLISKYFCQGTAATCTNGGLQIPVDNAEYTLQGIYCGTILASVDAGATAKVIPGKKNYIWGPRICGILLM